MVDKDHNYMYTNSRHMSMHVFIHADERAVQVNRPEPESEYTIMYMYMYIIMHIIMYVIDRPWLPRIYRSYTIPSSRAQPESVGGI